METALYRHYDQQENLLYVGISLAAMNRLATHERNANWFSKITRVDMERFSDRKQALIAEKEAIKSENPLHNIIHNSKTQPKRNLSITLDPAICDKLEEESNRLRKTGIKHTWTLSMIIEGLLRNHFEAV